MDAKSQGLLEELRDNPNVFTGLGICFAAGDALAEIERLQSALNDAITLIEVASDYASESVDWATEAHAFLEQHKK